MVTDGKSEEVFSNHQGQFPWSSQLVDVGDGVRQALVDEGPRESAVTFVCVHGNPTWGFLYRHFIRLLSVEYRVLVPDHVGFGRSDKPRDATYYSLERHIQNLTTTLKAAGAQNVVLVVQDWGGPIGMGWATRHPELVKGLVVMNTWAFVRSPVMKLPWLFKFLVRGKSGFRRVTEKHFFVESLLGRFGTVKKLEPHVMAAYRSAHPTPEDRMGVAQFPRLIPETPDVQHPEWQTMAAVEEGLSKLAAKPALIIWGLKDQAFRKPQLERWKGLFRNLEGPYLLKAGHFLQEDAWAEIIDRIRAWLPKVVNASS